jgi:hypothetical protein
MKTRLKVLPMVLCFSVVLTTSIFLTQRAAATENETERVTFNEPVMVAATLLEADTYTLVWNETGPQAGELHEGSKTVATASATLVVAESDYDGAIETKTLGNNSKVLERITWKKRPWSLGSQARAFLDPTSKRARGFVPRSLFLFAGMLSCAKDSQYAAGHREPPPGKLVASSSFSQVSERVGMRKKLTLNLPPTFLSCDCTGLSSIIFARLASLVETPCIRPVGGSP